MSQEKPTPIQTVIQVVCVAIGIVGLLVAQRMLGFDGIMWSTLFGAVGGGLGGLVGAILAGLAK